MRSLLEILQTPVNGDPCQRTFVSLIWGMASELPEDQFDHVRQLLAELQSVSSDGAQKSDGHNYSRAKRGAE